MEISAIYDNLNQAQRQAVIAPAGPTLVLAGAGSGKTRVLTSRIAHLIHADRTSPSSILAVTFTNKAAYEIRSRIEKILAVSLSEIWIGTFHGISHRILRRHCEEAGLRKDFQIIDSEDQLKITRRVINELNLNVDQWQPRQAQWFINHHKEEGCRAAQLLVGDDFRQHTLQRIYQHYETLCEQLGLVDFSELLLRAYQLLLNNEVLQQHYLNRFKHVLVDEFQDTNAIQYEWLKLLVQQSNNLFVVGDDDQSIYGWRGARVENILQFDKDFVNAQIIRLEQNYRSTNQILNVANAVIRGNQSRFNKKLWTAADPGDPVKVYAAFNEQDEAQFVVQEIQRWVDSGINRSQIAILYRSNAQSRVFEENLLAANIPYRVYGGLRFFDRAEIKDALAYLRLCNFQDDDTSFERVVNTPTRGIGARTLTLIREQAQQQQCSMWQMSQQLISGTGLNTRNRSMLERFIHLIEQLAAHITPLTLSRQVQTVLDESGLIDYYGKEKNTLAQSRVENLQELISAARTFEIAGSEDDLPPLTSFLAHAALESGDGQSDEWEDCVQLMSLHSAKGLEFTIVFLTGIEDGQLPHQRAIDEGRQHIEEERRLCYVGMTRAMRHLYLSHAQVRRLHGNNKYTRPSRFLVEIPQDLVQEVRPQIARDTHHIEKSSTHDSAFKIGTNVYHKRFGEGVVMYLEGRGEYARIQINFSQVGCKWLVLGYAQLQQL